LARQGGDGEGRWFRGRLQARWLRDAVGVSPTAVPSVWAARGTPNTLLHLVIPQPRTPAGETRPPSAFNAIAETRGPCSLLSRKTWSAPAGVVIFPPRSLPRPRRAAHAAASRTCVRSSHSGWFKAAGEGTLSNRSSTGSSRKESPLRFLPARQF